MTVPDLIAALAALPPTAIVRVFSTEAQDWLPITDIDHTVTLDGGTRIDLIAYPLPEPDED